MTTVPLDEFGSVTLDGSGNGQVLVGPIRQGQVWNPTMAACSVSTNTSEPVFYLYQSNGVSAGQFIGGSYTGSNDSTDMANITLYPGMKLLGRWLNGDPGATATLSIFGTMEVP